MNFLRFFLFPLAILYSLITSLRNLFFDMGIFSSKKYENPTIGVGNLSTGGTGKSVFVDYIISLIKDKKPVAVLSRGFGRMTKGFVEASEKSTFKEIGDEPKMLFIKHQGIRVGVAEKRRIGMGEMLKNSSSETVFIWDDCFQHRWVTPDLMILLTSYDHLFVDDYHLPVGNLRELSLNKKRADIVIVTKCPINTSEQNKKQIINKLRLANTQHLFFATIGYANNIKNTKRTFPINKIKNAPFLLVSGIADPYPFLSYIKAISGQFEHLKFPDHHIFSEGDISNIREKANGSIILTTEKDFIRLNPVMDSNLLFYLEIEMKLSKADQEQLNKILLTTSNNN